MRDLRPRDIIAVVVLISLLVVIALYAVTAFTNPDANDRAIGNAITGK